MEIITDKQKLCAQIFKISHLTGDFLLRSGTRSAEYFDKYRFESDPHLLRSLAHHLAALVPQQTDYLAGLELGGVPLATALCLHAGIPAVFVRKAAKNYGTCQLAEGKDIKGKTLCVIEDVITTGGQVAESVQELRDRGAIITTVLCVINRAGQTPDALAKLGLRVLHLFTMDELKAFK